MDRVTILDHLELAERHVSEGEEHVSRQRDLVRELERDGHDTTEARKLLLNFERNLIAHKADRDRLKRELSNLGQG